MVNGTTVNKSERKARCVALFSGGLDSALAILLMLDQDIEVTALTFMTHFGCDLDDRSSCGSNPYPAAEKFGFDVKLMHLGEKFIEIVKNPRYGRGRHMNPCIDCRILMLCEAKELMEMTGADFVVTGEVLGQRPMSQVRDKLNLVEKQSGLRGKLLRPLSARLLKPTVPELAGLVDRNRLESIHGRGRRRQMELADRWGLQDYPTPAAGCLLTDAGYSSRLRDLLSHTDQIDATDLNLLRVGRHFRLDSRTKLVVGRNEQENARLLSLIRPHDSHLEALGTGSPVTILVGDASPENLAQAARITARYSADRHQEQVEVTVVSDPDQAALVVSPARPEDTRELIIR